MATMRDLTKATQVTFWSAPEVRAALGRLLAEAEHEMRLKWRDKPIKQQVLINSLILFVESLPREVRRGAMAEGLSRLEEILGGSGGGDRPEGGDHPEGGDPGRYGRPMGGSTWQKP